MKKVFVLDSNHLSMFGGELWMMLLFCFELGQRGGEGQCVALHVALNPAKAPRTLPAGGYCNSVREHHALRGGAGRSLGL